MTGVAVVIDHDVESRAWLLGRFKEMAQDIVTTWDIAQDIAANWTEGRAVSELPECEGKYPAQVFREWLEGSSTSMTLIDKPGRQLLQKQLKAARVKRIAPSAYGDLPWTLYAEIPAIFNADQVADIFTRAEAQPVGVTVRGLRLVLGNATGMKPPYWQQVISAATTGERGLTPATARNLIATLEQWLEDNPDAPTRR